MPYLYLLLNLGSVLVPFVFSFHPKLRFYKQYKVLGIAILGSMLVFIPWDIIFTLKGIWGFNPNYFIGTQLLGLPIEEWLFFLCIPYACVFTHYSLLLYFPRLKLPIEPTKTIGYLLTAGFLLIAVYHYSKCYTFVNFLFAGLLTATVTSNRPELLQSYLLTFLVMLIPFFVVNSTLTGSFISNSVVWYNDNENLSIRLFTIPIEDSVYAFTLILLNLFIITLLEPKTK